MEPSLRQTPPASTWLHPCPLCTCMHTYTCTVSCAHMYVCTCAWAHTHMLKCLLYLYAYMYNACTPMHTDSWSDSVPVQPHTHTHTHTHTPTWQSKRMFSGFRSLQKIRENSLEVSQPFSEESWRPGRGVVPAGELFMEVARDAEGEPRKAGHLDLGGGDSNPTQNKGPSPPGFHQDLVSTQPLAVGARRAWSWL